MSIEFEKRDFFLFLEDKILHVYCILFKNDYNIKCSIDFENRGKKSKLSILVRHFPSLISDYEKGNNIINSFYKIIVSISWKQSVPIQLRDKRNNIQMNVTNLLIFISILIGHRKFIYNCMNMKVWTSQNVSEAWRSAQTGIG